LSGLGLKLKKSLILYRLEYGRSMSFMFGVGFKFIGWELFF